VQLLDGTRAAAGLRCCSMDAVHRSGWLETVNVCADHLIVILLLGKSAGKPAHGMACSWAAANEVLPSGALRGC
jgi:hypothetical protein